MAWTNYPAVRAAHHKAVLLPVLAAAGLPGDDWLDHGSWRCRGSIDVQSDVFAQLCVRLPAHTHRKTTLALLCGESTWVRPCVPHFQPEGLPRVARIVPPALFRAYWRWETCVRKQFIQVPEIVRMKEGALARLGLYLARPGLRRVFVARSEGLVPAFFDTVRHSVGEHGAQIVAACEVTEASVECAMQLLGDLPREAQVVVGLGGGKALDTGKHVAALAGLPFFAVPTSLTNDGFCSPQASLTLRRERRSVATGLPYAVIVDTEVCLGAPLPLWCSGVGDLAAKLTAVRDWKLAFHARGTPVNDLASLMSDATVFQFLANPAREPEGIRLLATALMLNGVAMEIAGSSRPASGSEHLISHALDRITTHSCLHGLQVGVATYLVSRLQRNQSERIATLFEQTGFWDQIRLRPFLRSEWITAVQEAPSLKQDFYTVLSERDCLPEVIDLMDEDPWLRGCFA